MTQYTQASVVALICGTILLLGGVFGIYYQGPFWASGVVAAMNPDEDALALGLPVGVTLAGVFLISYVLLASPLTAAWSPQRRIVVYVVFALSVLAACGVAAWLAGQVAGEKLQATQGPSNQSVEDEPPPRFSAHRIAAVQARLLRSTVPVGGGRSPLSLDQYHMLKWIGILFGLCVLALLTVSYLYGVSLRAAGFIEGKGALKMAYKHYLEHGYATNFGNSYQLWETTNTVTIGGTNYHCVLTVDVAKFNDHGVLSMTTNEVFIWQDKKRGAKLIPPGYRPPVFPPVY